MCGISATIVKNGDKNKYWDLLRASEIRGQDGTGYVYYKKLGQMYTRYQAAIKASDMPMKHPEVLHNGDVVIGQNRLSCFGLEVSNQQPLMLENTVLVHNGNLFDFESMFKELNLPRQLEVDSELILRIYEEYHRLDAIYALVKGNFACILIDRKKKQIHAFTRDKPLCWYEDDSGIYLFSTVRIGQKVFGEKAEIHEMENFSRRTFNF